MARERTPVIDWMVTTSGPRESGRTTGWRRLDCLLLEFSERPAWRVETRSQEPFVTGLDEGLLILPGTEHCLTMVGAGLSSTWSMIDCRWSNGSDPLSGHAGAFPVPARTMGRVRQLLKRISGLVARNDWRSALEANQARLELVLGLDLPWTEPPRADPRIRALLSRLEEDPARSWDCTALARAAELGLAQFHALFRRDVGVSPAIYVLRLRMRLAQSLLASTRLPVAAIAERCGFACPFHFSRAFRRRVGMTPRGFRAAQSG